jgi:hypothetical protein
MSYKYNPLLPQNLQKLQDIPEPPAPVYDSELSPTSENAVQNKVVTSAIEDTNTKKVSKFFTSINEIEVGEIGEYQGETNQNFTRGFFYERKDAVTITELGTTTDYVFSNYLDAYISNELYHQQYFISSNYGLSVTQYMSQSCTIGDNLISVIMFSTDFLKTNFAESYTNWNGTFYIYPYARINGSNFDNNNKLSIRNNVIYYKGQALDFTQSSRGVSNVYVGMEIETHLIYMWIPLFPGWIAFALDTAQVHAAYTETWSIFKIVDRLAVSRLTPSAHVTANDYKFSDQTPYAQIDTQQDSIAQYFNLLSSDADAVLVSCNKWSYNENDKPFPADDSDSIVYLKDEKKFVIAIIFSLVYNCNKLYRYITPDTHEIFYLIGGEPDNVEKEWTFDIIYPSAQSFDENDSMPINSRQLINFRTATTSLNGLMSAADKTDLTNFSTYFQKALVISSNTQAQGLFGAVYNITFITSTSINLSSTSIVIPAGSIGIYIPASTSTAVIILSEINSTTIKVHHKVSGTWTN